MTSLRTQELLQGPADELRIVLFGKTGTGKSATGNSILGREAFVSSWGAKGVTQRCQDGLCVNNVKSMVVVDTPGFLDPHMPKETIGSHLLECLLRAAPGPHAILLVVKVGPFTDEEENAVQMIQDLFGADARKHMIVLFTRKDELEGRSVEDYIDKCSPKLKKVLATCGNRYVFFNNKLAEGERGEQVGELMATIQKMQKENQVEYYASEGFQKAEKKIQTLEKELVDKRTREGTLGQGPLTPHEEAIETLLDLGKDFLKHAVHMLISLGAIAVHVIKILS